jgi:GDPmannose 4,6-dehydratase
VPNSTEVVLVTGVTGQDGSYLAERLVAEGHEVHGLVFRSDESKVVDGVNVHAGDLTEFNELTGLVRDVSPDLVFNLAGISSVAASWEQPVLTAQTTGVAAVALMDACWSEQERRGQEVRFLQASSAEIFGEADRSPQDERTAVRPVNPYGAAKAFAHHATGVYRKRGLHASSVILFNHESPRRPPDFVTRKITAGVAAIARGDQQVLALGNLAARRDWGWAPDYVDAMIRAVHHPTGDDYVVATGEARSVEEFVGAAFSHAGISNWGSLVTQDARYMRPVDATVLCGDATRARTVLGWQPTLTFPEIVGRMVDADLHGPT